MTELKTRRLKFHRRLSGFCHRLKLVDLPIPPAEIFIEVTNFCNLKCPICPQSYGLKRPKGNIEFEMYKSIIDEVKGHIPGISLFLAGESLLHKQIFEMIKYANDAGFYTRLHTNGTLLLEEKVERLLESKVDELSFSFDGPTKERYDAIRVGGDFEQTMRNIYSFLKLKKKKKLSRPYTIIQTILLKGENKLLIEKGMKDLFRNNAFDEVKIIESHSWAGTYDDYIRNRDSIGSNYFPCGLLYDRITVTWNGKVVGCCADLQARYICGDIREEPILKIWNNERYKNLRKMLIDGQYNEIDLCKKCDALWMGTLPLASYKKQIARACLQFNKLFGVIS